MFDYYIQLDTYQAIPGWRIQACPADFGNNNITESNNPPPIDNNVVTLHNMYSSEDAKQNPNLLDEIEEDVESECNKIGNVIAVSADPDGVVFYYYILRLLLDLIIMKVQKNVYL